MYITIKDTKNIIKPINNVIDNLFAGNMNVDITNLNTDNIIRTKTYNINVNELKQHHVTQEMYIMFNTIINDLCSRHSNPETEYISFKIPKKTHGFREINAPTDSLKHDQKEIAKLLQSYLQILSHDSAWAYIEGRDVVNAMKEHTKNESRWYLKLDLHDFFGSCNKEFITKQLKKLYPFADTNIFNEAMTDNILDKITNIAILNNGLPQGTPLSPVLTNLIMVEYDYKMNKMLYQLTKDNKLIKQKYIYTRYADDIIISARNKFDYTVIVNAIKELFQDTPLVLNEDKTRFGSNAGRNWNLGIMCNKDFKTTIGHKRKHELKAIINNYVYSHNEWELNDIQWLQGQLSWLQNVEPNYFKGFIYYINKKYKINLLDLIKYDIKKFNN